MSLDTPEQQLAERIRTDNAGWTVVDYPAKPSQVSKGKPFVSVFRASIVPSANRTMLDHELKVNVFASKQTGDGAAAELRELLDGVMLSIERYVGGSFKRADLKIFDEVYLGWDIDLTAPAPNTYRTSVIEERAN